MPGFGAGNSTQLDMEQLLAVTLYERAEFEPDEEVAQRDLLLAEQMDLLLETGELTAALTEAGISIHDVPEPAGLTAEMVAEYLAPARAALPDSEG